MRLSDGWHLHEAPASLTAVTTIMGQCRAVCRHARCAGLPTAAALALALSAAPSGVPAQGRPLGVEVAPAPLSERLGDCPVESLRAAWSEMDALEAVAVEQEVLRLCTERAERIATFLAAQESIDTALAEVLPAAPAVDAAASDPSSTGSDTPSARPDTGSNSDSASDPSDPPVPSASGSSAAPDAASPAGIGASGTSVAGVAGVSSADLPVPPVAPPEWYVVFTARSGDGSWQAGILVEAPPPPPLPVEAQPGAVPAPGAAEAAAAPVAPPPPPAPASGSEVLVLGAGDSLPGGPPILDIDATGVRTASEPDGGMLPWVPAPERSVPGDAEWRVDVLGGPGR